MYSHPRIHTISADSCLIFGDDLFPYSKTRSKYFSMTFIDLFKIRWYIYICVYIYLYGLYGSIFVDILGLYTINEPWWATNGTLYSIDHPPCRWIRQHLLFHRWIWSESTRPGILRGIWFVGWLQWQGCLDVIMVPWFMFTYIWMGICLYWQYPPDSHEFVLPSFLHMLCARFPFCWHSFRTPAFMLLTPPPHTQPCTKRNCLIWPVPPFCLLLGFSGWRGF